MPRGTVKWFNSQRGAVTSNRREAAEGMCRCIARPSGRQVLPGLNEGLIVEFDEVPSKSKTLGRDSQGSTLSRAATRSFLLDPAPRMMPRRGLQRCPRFRHAAGLRRVPLKFPVRRFPASAGRTP